MTMGSEDALEAAHAFKDATLVAIHNEGWVHLRETQSELAEAFNTLGAKGRLSMISRGVPLRIRW